MDTLHSRWIAPIFAGLALLVGGLGWATGQEAKAPADKLPQISRSYIKKASFHLPLKINEALRSQIREIHLFWKDPTTGSWAILQKCAPNQPGFDFEAEKEGEYWFTLVMIDKSGKSIPAEPEQSLFRMCVVVDLQAPTAEVQMVQAAANKGQIIQVDVRDANLDQRKTQVWYQTKDQAWRALEPLFQQPNRYCIPVQAATTGLIRVSAADLAGNVMERDYDLTRSTVGQLVPERGAPGLPAAVEVAQGTKPSNPTEPTPPDPFRAPLSPERFPGGIKPVEGDETGNAVRIPSLPASKPGDIVVHADSPPPAVAQQGGAPLSLAAHDRPVGPFAPAGTTNVNPPAPVTNESPFPSTPGVFPKIPTVSQEANVHLTDRTNGPFSTDRQLINHLQVLLAYKIEEVGASGVGKVEVWITRDQGKTWQKLCEDPQRKSPLAIELPGEGLFGITLVVSNGRGFGNPPPKSGDAPESWIEVDLTRPVAEITSVRPGTGPDSGAMFITWSARDRNLGTDSVELFYAVTRDGSWQSIGKGLKNEGIHRWLPPTNFGPQAFLRLVVRDLAGNTTVVETPQPVAVDDLSRPRGRLVRILPNTPEIRLDPTGN